MGSFGQSFHAASKQAALDAVKADESAPKEVCALLNSLVKGLSPDDASVQVEYSGAVNAGSASVSLRVAASAPHPTNNDIVPKGKK